MSRQGRQFLLLLWKNSLLQKRKVITTVFEIGLPTFFALILIFIRLRVTGEMKEKTVWGECSGWKQLSSKLPHNLSFTPDNEITRKVMRHVVSQQIGIIGSHGCSSEDEMVRFLMFENSTVNNTRDYLAGVVFTNSFSGNGSSLPKNIVYKLRFSSSPRNAKKQKIGLNPYRMNTNWQTDFIFPLYQQVGPRTSNETCGGPPGYKREGFLAVQHAVNMAVIKVAEGGNSPNMTPYADMSLIRHPYPAYNADNFILVIQQQFPLILMLSFVLVALNIVKDVVHEKERKLKESMKMMGLNNWLHWAAWFVKYLLFLCITVAVMTLFLCVGTAKGPVIGKTDPSVVFVYLLVYSVSTISFCFAVSVFFSKANSGAAAGGILFFVTYIPYFFIQPRYATFTWGQKLVSSLVSNVAMAYGGQIIGMFEGTGEGVQWSNIRRGASIDDNFSLFNVIMMMLADAVLYGMITWYVEAVFPGEFGVPQKWYFPFTCSYWCGTNSDEFVPEDRGISIGQEPEYFEADPEGKKAGIAIRNLRKEFKNGGKKKVAVCGMTLDMYEGHITALLGHNGAGKTTTMSMLTGFIPTSNGTARVNGFDIRQDIANVRSSLGLCPQHDVLFDTLTVEEHLTFFARLKGYSGHDLEEEINHMLRTINLEDKRHAQAMALSGGMKRKLSVAIALIGGSKVVILDEPSSGMDPEARRQLWNILQQNKAGRTMVLSTHFMDEADHLGDRIAIMAEGVVKCCGSSKFLKNKYGAGYHMIIVKTDNCDVNFITQRIKHHVPEAKLENNVAAELSFILPKERSSAFEKMFTEFDSRLGEMGIQSYGISVTTMEEVFLRVGEQSVKSSGDRSISLSDVQDLSVFPANGVTNAAKSKHGNIQDAPHGSDNKYHRSASFTEKLQRNNGIRLYMQQFYAMFIKRLTHTFRNLIVTSTQLGVPLFFTIAGLIVIQTFPGPHDQPALSLSIETLGDNVVVYALVNKSVANVDQFGNAYRDQFNKSQRTVVTLVNDDKGFKNNPDMTEFLLNQARNGIGGYNIKYLVAAAIESTEDSVLQVKSFFNNQAFHTPGVSLAMVGNALLRYVMNSSDYSLGVINHPLPRTASDKFRDESTSETTGFTLAFNIVFGMSFLASSFSLFLIKERATKAKHLQFTSGVRVFTFWSATFCWDILNYLMTAIALLITIWAFQVDAFIAGHNMAHIALLFFLYGCALLPFMYLCSFLFNVPASGYVWLTMFNILSGVATILAVGILSIPQLDLLDLAHALEWVFLVLLPNYCLGQGIEDYYQNYKLGLIYEEYCVKDKIKDFCEKIPNPCCIESGNCGNSSTCIEYNPNPLGWKANGIGRMLTFLCIQFVFYYGVLLLMESNIVQSVIQKIRKRTKPLDEYIVTHDVVREDNDVAKERSRIANNTITSLCRSDKLILSELSKCYNNHVAVNQISIGIPEGECFGLLGVNGAGKTSTFKMLTGDETLTSGAAFLNGYDVSTNIAEVRQYLGYCPQFDALIDQMTGRETLFMYARLRGIKDIPALVEDLLDALLLTQYADKYVQTYSGGNKRKLSTAIALIGNPPVVFLDEPTTGMDPNARRYLWDTLCRIRASGRTLILTSHSMEECEALCTRIAIMVNGQFKCLGSPQHLKNKFSEGYILYATIGTPVDGSLPDTKDLQNFIEQQFPGCLLKDVDRRMVHYHITDTSMTLARIFGTMETAIKHFNIEDYSVSQTTLEQVFINLAKSQVQPSEIRSGCCAGCYLGRMLSSCCHGKSASQEYIRHDSNASSAQNIHL
ncbi:phospholipid-transporting ATPase ABCA3-like isoform X2 [Dreissena polymorpha]|uniref:ABC transporter domain-containing protein n=1 Tax=Dreissena polymorpha TaxID=45954 RepID=A0A9D4RLQ8_DREPO|nr:phospholipid-transporting ATPase ABCA3-like isoform X2 [Dreissena polymorpha]XP_052266502.1 phospholipid-transporting ATPase ABCA3-like isoform X2 [Dreissena polymorpha]KAH3872038.1 hypothetical protein DPMN_035251 [Dreissena polymorpha]